MGHTLHGTISNPIESPFLGLLGAALLATDRGASWRRGFASCDVARLKLPRLRDRGPPKDEFNKDDDG